jgi:hypothetical protein
MTATIDPRTDDCTMTDPEADSVADSVADRCTVIGWLKC